MHIAKQTGHMPLTLSVRKAVKRKEDHSAVFIHPGAEQALLPPFVVELHRAEQIAVVGHGHGEHLLLGHQIL